MATFLQAIDKITFYMFRNIFLTALRTFKRHKLYTLINIAGLSLGIACSILIFSLIKYHLTFDKFHLNSDRIFRITTGLNMDGKKHISGVPSPLKAAFQNDYAFTEKMASVYTSANELVSIKDSSGDRKFEEDIAFAEPSFFEIFTFPLLQGDKGTALSRPDGALITEELAMKYFGTANAIGKTITIANKASFMVSGILKNLPTNTDRKQQLYLPYLALKTLQPWMISEEWVNVSANRHCFILLKPGVSPSQLNLVLPSFVHKYYSDKDAKEWQFQLQPLTDIHLNTVYGASVSKNDLVALGCIGLFIVLAACINFINLATAQATSRTKEIGVRKVLGGTRPQLFWQSIVETTSIAVLSLIAALVLAEIALPYINQLFHTQIHINLMKDVWMSGFLVLLLVFIVFSSGIYPGLLMAGIQPVLALKGKISQGSSGSGALRKGLVVTQFAISQLLIIGTIVIVNQMHYSQQADMGFKRDGIVILPIPDNQPGKTQTLKKQFSKVAGVQDMSLCYAPPAHESASASRITYGTRTVDEKFAISCRYADEDYVSVFGLKILAGRNLQHADTVREFLINVATVKALGFTSNDEVLGKKARVNGYSGTIVGVLKDFHNKSFRSEIEPLALTSFFVWYERCAIKIDLINMKRTLSELQGIWKKAYPNHLYKQEFLDERIAKLYETDNMMMTLVQIFTAIAVFIGCLSLFGLVSFMAAQKKKEVAVRKVLGSTVRNIVFLFFAEFGRLMLIAFAVAAPLGWWTMTKWLQNFAYRTDLSAGVFLLALLLTFLVVIITVGYKSVRAALADPAISLRSE
jgi:putative ABC transport system permease protein